MPKQIEWPKNPREGQEFSYIDPISGADFVTFVYFMGTWQHLSTK